MPLFKSFFKTMFIAKDLFNPPVDDLVKGGALVEIELPMLSQHERPIDHIVQPSGAFQKPCPVSQLNDDFIDLHCIERGLYWISTKGHLQTSHIGGTRLMGDEIETTELSFEKVGFRKNDIAHHSC